MMDLFERKLEDYLTVYKIPIGPNDLDPSLFVYDPTAIEPVLSPHVAAQIIKDLEAFSGEQPHRIKKAYIVGNALKPGNQDRHSSLNVILVLNKDVMDLDVDGLLAEEILLLAKSLSGRLALGTTHPINYRITLRDIEPSRHNAIYDLTNSKWHKLPHGVKYGKGSIS